MKAKKKQFIPLVFPVLSSGQENALSAASLADLLNVCPRTLRTMVHKERKHGYLIISDSSGYYRPANREEIQRFCRAMQSRITSASENQVNPKRILAQIMMMLILIFGDIVTKQRKIPPVNTTART